MAKFNFRSIFTLSFTILYAECAINFQTIFNARNETQFTVLDSHFVKIPNAQRSLAEKPEMKLSISSQIDQVSNSNSTWILKLGDQSTLDISVKNSSSLTEWIFVWKNYGTKNSGTKNPEPREICIHYSDAHWYNTYQSANHTFPMDPKSKSGTHQFGFLHASLYDYPNEFHAILEYLFVSSDGFGLLLDSQVPWFVRFDPSAQDPKFCFSVNSSWPYVTENHDPGYLDMKIRIFGSKNVRTVTDYVIHESGLIPKPSKIPDSRLFTHPTWSSFVTDLFHHKTEDEIENLMTNISKYGFSDLKNDISVEIYFDEKMSRNLGNYFDKFPVSFEPTVGEIHKNGYRFGVLVNGVVDDRTQDSRDFYLKNAESTCIDFSNPEAREYWKDLVETMKLKHKIDSLTCACVYVT